MKTYELFTGDELEIAELIQQRRYQLLIHSCIYYYLDDSIITDRQWDKWAKELLNLQSSYPNISKQVSLYKYFKDWDASTGAFLPITLDWVVAKAMQLSGKSTVKIISVPKKKVEKKKLF